MIFVKVNDARYHAKIDYRASDPQWDGREVKVITLPMSYKEAAETFVDGVVWSIVNQPADRVNEIGETITHEPVEYNNSEFCIVGDITVHRDGTVTVKMGKLTELEETIAIFYGGVE